MLAMAFVVLWSGLRPFIQRHETRSAALSFGIHCSHENQQS